MIDLVIDPGHGGSDSGAIGKSGVIEKECTLYIANKIRDYLEKSGLTIKMTRYDDRYVTLEERVNIANRNKAQYFMSIHINSAEVSSAEGTEIYTLSKENEGEQLAESIREKIISNLQLKNRGIKFANFTVLKETTMPSILIETCFISNFKEEALLTEENFKNKISLAIANGFLRYLGKKEIASEVEENTNNTIMTPILSLPTALKAQALQWAKNRDSTDEFIALAELFWDLSSLDSMINPVVAYAQSALETDFGRFNKQMPKDYKNTCGLKVVSFRGDEIGGYAKFETWTSAVQAQLDHLALYAGARTCPKKFTKDPRHFPYLLGKAKYVEELSGNWSPSIDYGIKILKLMKEIETTSTKEEIIPVELDKNTIEYKDNGKDINIEGLKKEVSNIVNDIESIKNRILELKTYINAIEGLLAQEKKLREALNSTNISLQEKSRNYEETIEDILNIIGKLKSII